MNEYDKQASDFLNRFNIGFRATLSDSKPAPWQREGKEGHHFRITLSKGRRGDRLSQRMTFDFWASIADRENGVTKFRPYDVLASISGDVNCPETFDDFCSEYGYDKDSITALQTFRRCAAFAKRLRAFFTAEEIEALNEIR